MADRAVDDLPDGELKQAIAGYYEALWRKLTEAEHPAPEVVSIYPAEGATDVPTAWQPATITPETFYVLDAAGQPVPPRPGFPRPGPWGSDGGTHSLRNVATHVEDVPPNEMARRAAEMAQGA